MTQPCKNFQDTLAEQGLGILRDDSTVRQHVAECESCSAFVSGYRELEAGLTGLSPIDAPDPVVEELLARPELQTVAAESRRRWLPSTRLSWGTIAATGLLAVVGVTLMSRGELFRPVAEHTELSKTPPGVMYEPPATTPTRNEGDILSPETEALRGAAKDNRVLERVKVTASREVVDLEKTDAGKKSNDEYAQNLPIPQRSYRDALIMAPGVADPDGEDRPNVHGSRNRDFRAIVGGVSSSESITFGRAQGGFADIIGDPSAPQDPTSRFLARRSTTERVGFRDARGYWANTYVPGDPKLRMLQAALATRDRSDLQAYSSPPLRLHDDSRRTPQYFDAPEHSALALQLHADRRAVDGESRTRLQIGIQSTSRHGGRRPAMNIAVVLDLRGTLTDDVATGMRALVDAMGRARDMGDRFRLVVAGRPGGVIVEPADFRHGYLAVTLDRLLAGELSDKTPTLGIVEAVTSAIESVSDENDETAPLGSSTVMVFTGQPLTRDLDALSRLAHSAALGGIPTSVVAVGGNVPPSEVDRLALAGQGGRRVLERPSEAAPLIDRELSTISRVVARAVRLNIQLASGVRLVDVLGSHRLDEASAQRVRDAENSIDRRMARNLGIDADRGKDDDGIQIVIPNFHADDHHVILLDLVVPGPGPVADVTMKFKDLVQLRNGTAQSTLSLDAGEHAIGPFERNVLKTELAFHLSVALEEAGRLLAWGDRGAAANRLRTFQQILTGVGERVPDLFHDEDLARDIAMLDEYASLLESGAAAPEASRLHLSESLQLAALLRRLPPPIFE